MTSISLIICTKNRSASLARTLNALEQNLRSFPSHIDLQIVLVDNGSTDATPDVMANFRPPCPVVLVNEKQPGLASARNAGIACATGTLIAFTDDDCELSSNYFPDLLQNAAEMGALFFIGGRVDLGDPADLPITIKPSSTAEVLIANASPAGFIHGCNMAFTRSVVETIGLFDARFGAGAALKSGEDTDYIIRAFLSGVPIKYFPNMLVRHFHGRRHFAEAKALIRQYEYGNGALVVKHSFKYPILLKNFLFNLKDIGLEMIGRRKRIDGETGVGRFDIFLYNIRGAAKFFRDSFTS